MNRKLLFVFALVFVLIGVLCIAQNVQRTKASGTVYIRVDGSVEGTDRIQRDGDIYTFSGDIDDDIVVERSNIIIDGNGYTLQGPGGLIPSKDGISLSGRTNVTIKNVKIREFNNGIWLNMSSNNSLYGNNITENRQGILLDWSQNNSIAENSIIDNLEGIYLFDSSNNIIVGNNITNNQLGIQLLFSSNNTISENNIVDNDHGIQLNSHSMFGYTSNNTIYHNNFINTEQVWVIELGDIPTHTYTNFWDDGYPSGGNYWSDYGDKYPDAEEIDESGIWNTPYVINENNQDNYPLMSPWGPGWKPPEPSRTANVSEAEWFKYGDISFNWTSNDPNATIPGFEWNEIEWTMISIVDVSGTNVTGQMTTHFKNGTEKVVGGYVDIETGEGENMTMFVISANLEENDTVYTSGEMSLVKMNETIVRTYPDGVRETNHLNLTVEFSYMEFYQYMSLNYYWDKSTVILVEMSQEESHQTGEYVTNSSLLLKITESNVWVIPEFPSFLILPLFMIATLLAIIAYRKKHR